MSPLLLSRAGLAIKSGPLNAGHPEFQWPFSKLIPNYNPHLKSVTTKYLNYLVNLYCM